MTINQQPEIAIAVLPVKDGKVSVAIKVKGFAAVSVDDGTEGVVMHLGAVDQNGSFEYNKTLPET